MKNKNTTKKIKMSKTPRTDNSVIESDWLGMRVELVNAEFARNLELENATLLATISTQSSLLKRWLELAEEQSETLNPMTYTEFQKKDGLVRDTYSGLNTPNEDTKS